MHQLSFIFRLNRSIRLILMILALITSVCQAQSVASTPSHLKLKELYYSTFACKATHTSNDQDKTTLISYSSFYSPIKLQLSKQNKIWNETLKTHIFPYSLPAGDNQLWVIVIDIQSYSTQQGRDALLAQIQKFKSLVSEHDLVVAIDLNHAMKKNEAFTPKPLKYFELDRWLKTLFEGYKLGLTNTTTSNKDINPLTWVYGLQDQLNDWAKELQPEQQIVYMQPCEITSKAHKPRVKILMFSDFSQYQPLESKSPQHQQLKNKLIQNIQQPQSPLYLLHLFVISNQKSIKDEIKLELGFLKNTNMHLQNLLLQPTLDQWETQIKESRDFYQHLFMIQPVAIRPELWQQDLLDISFDLVDHDQKLNGSMAVLIKDNRQNLETVVIDQNQTAPIENEDEVVIKLDKTLQWALVGFLFFVVLMIFIRSTKKTPTGVFQPKLNSLDKTRPVSDLVGFDLYADAHSQSHQDEDINDLSPSMDDPVMIQKPTDDNHIDIRPHWSKNTNHIEEKSVVSKVNKSANHGHQTKTDVDDDWFQNSEQRHSQTFNIVNQLAKPNQNIPAYQSIHDATHKQATEPEETQNIQQKSNTPSKSNSIQPVQPSYASTYIKQRPEHQTPEPDKYYAYLEVLSGPMKDYVFYVTQYTTVVGRAMDANCALPPSGKEADLAISRNHFILYKQPNQWHLKCTSNFGMFVNQEKVIKDDVIVIEDFDRIKIGQSIFVFRIKRNQKD